MMRSVPYLLVGESGRFHLPAGGGWEMSGSCAADDAQFPHPILGGGWPVSAAGRGVLAAGWFLSGAVPPSSSLPHKGGEGSNAMRHTRLAIPGSAAQTRDDEMGV